MNNLFAYMELHSMILQVQECRFYVNIDVYVDMYVSRNIVDIVPNKKYCRINEVSNRCY